MVNILLSLYNFNEEWAKEKISKYIKTSDKVVIIPFSFSEKWIHNNSEWQNAYKRSSGKYYKDVVEPFLDLGIDEDNITWLNYFEDTNEKMRKIVEKSDIVFLTGGLTEKAVERVLEKDLLNSLKKSRVVIGSSAGALMQLNEYFTTPDKDHLEFFYSSGLGLINKDFYIEVHYDETDLQKSSIKRALKEKTDIVYAIKDNGGLLINEGKIGILGDVVVFKNEP